ncbi:hypothetical protein GYA37_02750 [candidate division WWE3 bacterium]|uniref:Uncharacterized protein n=1 Tax=candidate division WWE3 bacterium TaxID=2053526 RepID=A0A7X9E766_UNCKA|nr:hypothetical protein [candidate division WWE3 bacterium]
MDDNLTQAIPTDQAQDTGLPPQDGNSAIPAMDSTEEKVEEPTLEEAPITEAPLDEGLEEPEEESFEDEIVDDDSGDSKL